MADSFKVKVLKEINRIADNPVYPENERKIADWLGNRIADLEDAETKRALYALMTKDSRIRNLMKYLPEEGSEIRDFVFSEQKPVYTSPDRKKIGEMFASVGGENILDQSSPKFFGVNKDIDRAKVRAVAKANGMTEQELWKAMQEESTKMEREKIASGEREESFGDWLGVKALGIVAPRSVDVVREGKGEEDLTQAMTLDALENALFLGNPVGRGLGSLGARSFGKALQSGARKGAYNVGVDVAESFGTPALMNVTESIAKGEPQDPTDILYQGSANLVGQRALRHLLGRFTKNRGDVKKVERAFTGEPKEAEQQTFKEFAKETEEALKKKERIAGKGGRFSKTTIKPEDVAELKDVKHIVSGNSQLDETATEIAKIVGKEGVSVEKATDKYFNKILKSKNGGEEAYAKKFEDVSKSDGKTYFVRVDDKIIPTNELVDLIGSSSWGKVLSTKFAKPPKAKKKTFTEKYLTSELEGTTRPDYLNWVKMRGAKAFGKDAVSSLPVINLDERERERENRLKAEAEQEAMQKYLYGVE